MDRKPLVESKIKYRDYPPTYDQYLNQRVEGNVESAINMILRALYGKNKLLPSVPDLFLDIERYKHMLDDNVTVLNYKRRLTEIVLNVVPKMQPSVHVEVDKTTSSVNISIMLYDEWHYVISLINAQDMSLLDLRLDKKRFYE